MSECRISVIVPVYNVEKYLIRCVESLLEQKGENGFWEIILIDDGSRDSSGQICDNLAERSSKVRVFHKDNGGLSSARNKGISVATGDYVMFVDSDDYIECTAVNALEKTLKKYPMIDAIVFDGMEDNEKNCKVMRGKTSLSGHCVSGRDYLLEHYKNRTLSVEACLYLYKKDFLDKNNLRFREGILHEDVEFTPRAILAADQVAEISDTLYHYVVRGDSISTSQNKEKNIKDLFQTLEKLNVLAEQQDRELCLWMKNAVLNSYLNMIYETRMYQARYRKYIDKRFLFGKAATVYNRMRVLLCFLNVHLYCKINDISKKLPKSF